MEINPAPKSRSRRSASIFSSKTQTNKFRGGSSRNVARFASFKGKIHAPASLKPHFLRYLMNAYYQSQIWAYQLYLRGSGGDVSALSRSISNARIDLNPHQVDAALFSLRSPFANGVILADEVGLGKTIEAGLVITQKWAERKRRVLIVVPAMLRNQWRQELLDKFFISSVILDSKVFNRLKKDGALNPFDLRDEVAVCSYNFAAAKEAEIAQIPWDLVVFDEAHRLRNLYQSFERGKKSASAKKSIARRIVEATSAAPKLLLTATPLQNSLLGRVVII